MKNHQDFIIPFKGLQTGEHRYHYEIDDAFFEGFEYFEGMRGKLAVDLDLLKETSLLDLHFHIGGVMQLECDRCLKAYDQPLSGDFRLIVKLGEDFAEESDEVVVIPQTESRLDLRQFLFEYINLLLPLQHVHENIAECDQEVIRKLDEYSGPGTDPRWEALKDIDLSK